MNSIRKFQSRFPVAAWLRGYQRVVHARLFPRFYLIGSGVVLVLSTLLWSVLDARLQNANADEGILVFLFRSPGTLSGDYLPSAHSFLLKWPLFFLLRFFMDSRAGLIILTVLITLLTVGAFAWLLSRFERRPLVLGTLWLLLAVALLMVPPLPYASSFLPVSMAMLATRNIEYICYISALWLMVRYHNLANWRFWAGSAILALLIASDKLFLVLGIGGALGALLVYCLSKNSDLIKNTAKFLLGAVIAAAAAEGCLALISAWRISHMLGGGTGPYDVALSLHDTALGIIYAVSALATNAGANPAYQTTVLARMPGQAVSNLWGWAGLALLVNIAVWLVGCWLAVRFLTTGMRGRNPKVVETASERTVLLMIWSTLAALVSFILTNHYYAGDARYLSIGTFTLFMVVALYARQREWSRNRLTAAGVVILIAITLAVPAVIGRYNHNQATLAAVEEHNDTIASVMAHHRSYVLVGGYWRVVPIKLRQASISIMPMEKCTDFRAILARIGWHHDLNHTDFAYLFTPGRDLIGSSSCSEQKIEKVYGRPDKTVVIAGTTQKPAEVLLFYSNGSK